MLPEGVTVDEDNSDRPERATKRYRASVPSWCFDAGERYAEKRGFLSIAAAHAWRELQIRRGHEAGKTSGRRAPSFPVPVPLPPDEDAERRARRRVRRRKEGIPDAAARLVAAREAAVIATECIEAQAARHSLTAQLSDAARAVRHAELVQVKDAWPRNSHGQVCWESSFQPYDGWRPNRRARELGPVMLLRDWLFCNLAAQVPDASAEQIVHEMARCHDYAPLAYCLLTRQEALQQIRARYAADANSLGDVRALEANFERAARRIFRPRYSLRDCDKPCGLPCAWCVVPHPEQSVRLCYPWRLAPHDLPGHSDFASMRNTMLQRELYCRSCRCEACSHVWCEGREGWRYWDYGAEPCAKHQYTCSGRLGPEPRGPVTWGPVPVPHSRFFDRIREEPPVRIHGPGRPEYRQQQRHMWAHFERRRRMFYNHVPPS